MDITSSVTKTKVKREVTEIVTRRTYLLSLTREELNLLRGLHFRLHNGGEAARLLLASLPNYSVTDGPVGFERYDAFLGELWHATNKFNQEAYVNATR